MHSQNVSKQTQTNWWLDTTLALSALGAILSGIYFLYFPVGGYQGGRNPYYNIILLFNRHTWEDVHTWTGVAMIAAAMIHLARHLPWVATMLKRIKNEILGRATSMNNRARFNLWLNVVVGVSFLLTAVSGLVFLFLPEGHNSVGWMLSATTWDLIHTWGGVILIAAAVVHFAIHWKWVTKVTGKIFAMRPHLRQAAAIKNASHRA